MRVREERRLRVFESMAYRHEVRREWSGGKCPERNFTIVLLNECYPGAQKKKIRWA
jgi:hypothetical protein